jgi:lipopolysaccharide export system protein LptA
LRRWRAGLAAAALLAPLPAAAQLGTVDQDKGKPVQIEAEQGIEWQQNAQVYIARGHAKVTRGGVTINADTISAYYRPSAKSAPKPETPKPATSNSEGALGGSTEIYRAIAEGNVRIATATQTVYGDRAVYDLDESVVVVTGKNLRLETPEDLITARDSLEWYDAKQLAVARGDAVAIREPKRVRADVLVAQVTHPPGESAHVSRVDAHGNVVVSSMDQIGRGSTGVYNADTGIATLSGNVTLTRGDNELKGQYGVVDLNNNVSRLLAGPPGGEGPAAGRVQGLIVPRQAGSGDAGAPAAGEEGQSPGGQPQTQKKKRKL